MVNRLERIKETPVTNFFLLAIALVSSVAYAIYLKRQQHEIFYTIHSYFLSAYTLPISYMLCIKLFLKYLKKLSIIYVLSCFLLTYPLAVLCIFIVIFSYGFTISSFILLYGVKGIVVGMILYGVQAIMMCYLSLKIGSLPKGEYSVWHKLPLLFTCLLMVVSMDLLSVLIFRHIKLFIV